MSHLSTPSALLRAEPTHACDATRVPLRRFRMECEMIPHVANSLHAVLQLAEQAAVTVVSELTVGGVIPDIVVGVWRGATPIAPPTKLCHVEAAVLCLLQKQGAMKVQSLPEHVHLTDSGASRALSRLSRAGAIRIADGSVHVVDDDRLYSLEIIALEVKIRRWRQAVSQAAIYRDFADRSYAVLDATQTRVSLRMLMAFEDAGVGLLMQYGDHTRELLPAAASSPVTAARIQVARTLAQRLVRERQA